VLMIIPFAVFGAAVVALSIMGVKAKHKHEQRIKQEQGEAAIRPQKAA
jgi:hypothetical protein